MVGACLLGDRSHQQVPLMGLSGTDGVQYRWWGELEALYPQFIRKEWTLEQEGVGLKSQRYCVLFQIEKMEE